MIALTFGIETTKTRGWVHLLRLLHLCLHLTHDLRTILSYSLGIRLASLFIIYIINMTRLDERYLDTSGKKILRHDLVYKASSHLQTHIYSVGERPGAIKVRPIILSIIWLKSEYGAQAISLIHDLSSGFGIHAIDAWRGEANLKHVVHGFNFITKRRAWLNRIDAWSYYHDERAKKQGIRRKERKKKRKREEKKYQHLGSPGRGRYIFLIQNCWKTRRDNALSGTVCEVHLFEHVACLV